jgi:diguanylate cyclase (GGDEF)-like protein
MGAARISSAGRRGIRAATDALSPGGVVVLLAGIVLSVAAGLLLTARDRQQEETRVRAQLRQAADSLPARLQRTEVVLRAAPGFAQSLDALTPERWQRTVGRLNVAELAPSIRTIMLVEPTTTLHPAGELRLAGEEMAGARLRLVAPATTGTGFFLLDDVRAATAVAATLEQARDTGEPRVSPPVQFTRGALPGTELFIAAPLYEADRPGRSVAERRTRLRAWVAAAFRVDRFLDNALVGLDRDVALEIVDRGAEGDHLVARFAPDGPISANAFVGAASAETNIMHRRWVLRATSTRSPSTIHWGALGLCLLITAFVVAQLATRRRAERRALALAAERTADLEERTSELQHRALHDTHTGLANRLLVRDRLEQALRHREGVHVAVLVIDLDRFKLVNDEYGHLAGDQVLTETARRMRTAMRPDDTCGRLGGDEFVVIAEVPSEDEPALLAARVVDAFRVPMAIAGRELVLTTSVGVAVARSGHAEQPDTVMHNADAAMYRVKRAGGNAFALFDDTMQARALDRLQLESDLRRAIASGELVVHYQPTVDARTHAITGVEALVRWQRGDALAPPNMFIPVAEESGLIVALGAEVLDQALVQACAWRAAGTPRRVWVNVSARQLAGPTFVDDVRAALDRHTADGSLLGLEVTESALLDDPEQARGRLAALQAMGIAVAVDDFGTGYSSFERLKAFGLDVVKLDRSFVEGVNDDRYDRAIVEAVVRMAHGLDATLVAEGVETDEQAHTLRELGCDTLQGYRFGRPGPAAEIDRMATHEEAGRR